MHLLLPLLLFGQPGDLLKPGDTILFLGDSNTFAGGYIAQLDAALRVAQPDAKYRLVNLGLPSETCSGLTEKDHPFPRPDIHERLDRALAEIEPSVVFVCYGMNDGIYWPFSEDRFQAYQAGIRKLIEKIRAVKARPIVLTPSPFDAVPLGDKTRPATADDFSYKAPFAGYDGVLRRYSDWLLTLRAADLPVIDVHQAITEYLGERRKTDPKFTMARDGIHPDAVGHARIARAILAGLKLPSPSLSVVPGKVVEGCERPIVGPFRLVVEGAVPGKSYDLLVNGAVVATTTTGEIDLATLPKFPATERGVKLLDALRKQHGVLDLALLTAIGHKRPQTPKGISVDEARKQADEIEKGIVELLKPMPVKIEVTQRP